MKKIMMRGFFSFLISIFLGVLTNLLIELIVSVGFGVEHFTTISNGLLRLTGAPTLAAYLFALSYGIIGFAFASGTFIYELSKIGYLIQNVLYYLYTGVFWIPIVLLVWRLYEIPEALLGTLIGFTVSYIIMTVVGYHIKRKEVLDINDMLAKVKEVQK